MNGNCYKCVFRCVMRLLDELNFSSIRVIGICIKIEIKEFMQFFVFGDNLLLWLKVFYGGKIILIVRCVKCFPAHSNLKHYKLYIQSIDHIQGCTIFFYCRINYGP